MEINERFAKVIEYSEMSPAEFSEEIGVQRSSISHILSGRNKPSLDFIIKIKTRFPDLEWDWLINGEGNMLIEKEKKEIVEEPKKNKSSLPDLFSLIEDDFEPNSKNNLENNKPQESIVTVPKQKEKNINDSQRLGNQNKNVRRIVFFYTDGTFETYEN